MTEVTNQLNTLNISQVIEVQFTRSESGWH